MKEKNSIKRFSENCHFLFALLLEGEVERVLFQAFFNYFQLKIVYCLKLIGSELCSIKTMMRSVAMATIMKGPVDQRQFCMWKS